MTSASVIADSSHKNSRITTFELEYPRFIHGEFMTHRLFSRNAASSRAIPIKKMQKQVWSEPAMPVAWGKNQSGMQADHDLGPVAKWFARKIWRLGGKLAVLTSKALSSTGLHKQLANRVLEPWQLMKVVVTATEFENFFWLRDHEDAQPEIAALAIVMQQAMTHSEPKALKVGEWHLPYDEENLFSLDERKVVSVSGCAQVSYRTLDLSRAKAKKICDMLVDGQRVHASPFEHQATPISQTGENPLKTKGVTHCDVDGNLWSGNFKGWIQHRQLIKGHVKNG